MSRNLASRAVLRGSLPRLLRNFRLSLHFYATDRTGLQCSCSSHKLRKTRGFRGIRPGFSYRLGVGGSSPLSHPWRKPHAKLFSSNAFLHAGKLLRHIARKPTRPGVSAGNPGASELYRAASANRDTPLPSTLGAKSACSNLGRPRQLAHRLSAVPPVSALDAFVLEKTTPTSECTTPKNQRLYKN
jgi:hypothetical protein